MEIKRLSLADKELITEYIINELCEKLKLREKELVQNMSKGLKNQNMKMRV